MAFRRLSGLFRDQTFVRRFFREVHRLVTIRGLLKGFRELPVIIHACQAANRAYLAASSASHCIAAIRFCLVRGLMISLLRTDLCTYQTDLLV